MLYQHQLEQNHRITAGPSVILAVQIFHQFVDARKVHRRVDLPQQVFLWYYKNFESDPHPGDLRHLVEIGYTENSINANGYPEPKDVVVCKVWAACTDAGNQHYRAADVMNTEQVINFTIRYRDDIKPGMWVRFRGEKWDISTLGEYSFKRTYLGLKASLSKGVSG